MEDVTDVHTLLHVSAQNMKNIKDIAKNQFEGTIHNGVYIKKIKNMKTKSNANIHDNGSLVIELDIK